MTFLFCRAAVAGVLLTASVLLQAASPGPQIGRWGVDTQYITRSVAPGDDFYRHVNKGWLDTAKIPAGFPMAGSFVDLELRTEAQVQTIIDEARKNPGAPGSSRQQIADMYASFMDVERRNKLGITPLQGDLNRILQANDRRRMAGLMGRPGHPAIVNAAVVQDPGRPRRYILTLEQSGLGLPGRDYYLKKEEPYAGFRKAYLAYIEGVFERAKLPNGKASAAAILAFETAIAERHWTPEQARDAVKNRYPIPVSGLARYAPGLDWDEFLAEAGFKDAQEVDVRTNTAVKALAALFAATPVETLRAWSAFHLLDNYASMLSEPWVDARFDMYSRKLAGIQEQRPLGKRAVDFLNQLMSEQIGRLYAERYFTAEAKTEIDKLVRFLRIAFRERLEQVPWMDRATRTAAAAKLEAVTTKIGYPDRWHDFSRVQVSPSDLVGNVKRFADWAVQDARAKLDEPVRKWEWDPSIMPQVINAYYNPNGNEIVFPAAILQPPFFDPKADPAVNFGAIGAVIGHELGHGFDDQGSRYDGSGLLRNWWTKAAQEAFDKQTQRLVGQYDQYTPLPGLKVNGLLTLGENIGDLGGIAIAWSGYQRFAASEYKGKPPVLDGFTGNQRFFLGFAQVWRGLYTDGFLRQAVLTDPHPPNEFRVNGVLRNFGPWYEAFDVTPKHKLYMPSEQRVTIW